MTDPAVDSGPDHPRSPILERPGAIDADDGSPDRGVPLHHGDPLGEQRAAETGAIVVDRSHRDVLSITGAERLTWLEGFVSQHVADLPAHSGGETLVLDAQGRVEHHALLATSGDTVYLDTEAGRGQALLGFLQKMVFWADAAPVRADLAVVTLAGGEVEVWWICEDHTGGAEGPRTDEDGAPHIERYVVAVPLDGSAAEDPAALRRVTPSSRFVANPRLSPDGQRLAWLSWEHPQMPWDGTALHVAPLLGGSAGEGEIVAGGLDVSVLQPEWLDAERLLFLSDSSGWWNPWTWSAEAGAQQVLEREEEFGGPLWALGTTWYRLLDADRALVEHGRAATSLSVLRISTGELSPLHCPLTSIGALDVRADGLMVLDGASPTQFTAIHLARLDRPQGGARVHGPHLEDGVREGRAQPAQDGHEVRGGVGRHREHAVAAALRLGEHGAGGAFEGDHRRGDLAQPLAHRGGLPRGPLHQAHPVLLLERPELRGDGRLAHAERAGGRLILAVLDKPTRRLGEENHAGCQYSCPDELDSDGDLPCRVVLTVLRRVVYDIGEEDTDGDRPLIPRDNGTTKRLRGALRLVHRYEDGDEPDPEASEEAANDEGGPVVGASLEGNTKGEHKTGNHDTRPSFNNVSRWSSAEGA